MVEIGHSIAQQFATTSTFFKKKQCCLGTMSRRLAMQTRYTLWHYTMSIKKDLIQ